MKAVLLVIRKSTGAVTGFPGGVPTEVSLDCDGTLIVPEQVLTDTSFEEFDPEAPTSEVVSAIRLSSDCLSNSIYLVGATVEDISNLQKCCKVTMNVMLSLGCEPTGLVEVVNVIGTAIGTVLTPAELVTLWNSDPINMNVGVLFALTGWNFVLKTFAGSFIPSVVGNCLADDPGEEMSLNLTFSVNGSMPNSSDLVTAKSGLNETSIYFVQYFSFASSFDDDLSYFTNRRFIKIIVDHVEVLNGWKIFEFSVDHTSDWVETIVNSNQRTFTKTFASAPLPNLSIAATTA